MTLRTRLALISAAAVALVVVLTVVTAQAVARNELLGEIDESLYDRAEVLTRGADFVGGPGFDGGLDVQRRGGPDNLLGRGDGAFDTLLVQLLVADGTVRRLPGQTRDLPVEGVDSDVAAGAGGAVVRTVDEDGAPLRMITVPVDGGALQIARSLGEYDAAVEGVTRTLTIAGGIGVALAGLLGLLVARGALRPVGALTETVEHVAETGQLTARIEVERNDEIGRLATSFNAMLEALEMSKVEQRRLVRDAGHELRTPLTALRTNIELLDRADSMDPAQREELLEAAMFELGELTKLAVELVELAADPSAVQEATSSFSLVDLVERVVQVSRRRTGRDVTLAVAPRGGDATVVGRAAALDRAVANLLDNADKWSPPDAPIEVEVVGGRVTVADHGPGIAVEDRPLVFDRFYRATDARSQPGSGLGLAIVKKIVEEHGGTVFVGETDGGGATVGFSIPTD